MTNFNEIPASQAATPKQIWAVSRHLAALEADEPSEAYGLTKVFNAILNTDHRSEKPLTHGMIQDLFKATVVPKAILSRVEEPKVDQRSKAAAKPKKTVKAAQEPKAKAKAKRVKTKQSVVAKPKAKANPEPTGDIVFANQAGDLAKTNTRLDSLEHRFGVLEENVGDIKAGMQLILESLAASAE